MNEWEKKFPDRLDFWSLIKRTLAILKERPLFFFGLAALTVFPSTLLKWWGFAVASSSSDSFLAVVFSGLIAYDILNALKNHPVSFSQTLAQALRWPLLGIALLWALLVLALAQEAGLERLPIIFMLIITAIVSFGDLYLTIIFLVAAPACVIEELGCFDSVKRSLALTSGHWWGIFCIMVGVVILFFLPSLLLYLPPASMILPGFFMTGFVLDVLARAFLGILLT